MTNLPLYERIPSTSYLEHAFLRWILHPAAELDIVEYIVPQFKVEVPGHTYKIDYVIQGAHTLIAVELDGFEFHGNRSAFTYDRLRQNDLQALGFIVIRFS